MQRSTLSSMKLGSILRYDRVHSSGLRMLQFVHLLEVYALKGERLQISQSTKNMYTAGYQTP